MIQSKSFQETNPMRYRQESKTEDLALRDELDGKIEVVSTKAKGGLKLEPSGRRFIAEQGTTLSSRALSLFSGVLGSIIERRPSLSKEAKIAAGSGVITEEAFEKQSQQNKGLILFFLEFMKSSSDKDPLLEMIQNLKYEVKESILSNKEDVFALLISRPVETFSLEKLLSCNPINQHFIFSQSKDILSFGMRVDLYEDLLVMQEDEVQFMAHLFELGFDLEALFQMKVTLDEYGRSIGFAEITRGFAAFSKGALVPQSRSPALTDAILMIVFIEFMKGSRDKGSIFQMLAELKSEVKEVILLNLGDVLVLLRSKLKSPGHFKRLLSQNPINQRFVFSHAKAIFFHDEKHHKDFLESTMYDKRGMEGGPIHLYGSMYEEILWVDMQEILDATDLIKKGVSLTVLFQWKELMNQLGSSISFSEIKGGILGLREVMFDMEFQGLSEGRQVLIILFMEFVKDSLDKRSVLKKLAMLDWRVEKVILSNKTCVLYLLRAVLGDSFCLETVLNATLVNQLFFFSLEEVSCEFIDPKFLSELTNRDGNRSWSAFFRSKKSQIEL